MRMQQRRFNLNEVPPASKRRIRACMLRDKNTEARMKGRNAYNFRPTKALLFHEQTREIYLVARDRKDIFGVIGRLSGNGTSDATIDFKVNGFMCQFPIVAVSRREEKAILAAVREAHKEGQLLGF